MQVVQVDVSALLAMSAPYNPRTMPAREMASLRRSLRTWGAVQPVLVNQRTKHIIGGHQRVQAASAEGIEHLPVVYVDLDEPSERQLNLALNRISGEWDEDALGGVLAAIRDAGADMELTGFDGTEVEALLRRQVKGDAIDDEVPPPPVTPVTKHGELIRLGRHALLCGDSTNAKMVQRLFGTETADGIWTDPPYGVEYQGGTKEKLTIQNDGKAGLAMLLLGAFAAADAVLQPGAAIYVAHPDGALSLEFRRCIVEAGWTYAQTLIWVKNSLVLGHSDYRYRHEPIGVARKPKGKSHDAIAYAKKPAAGRRGRGGTGWFGDNAQTSVIEIPRPTSSQDHPTMKPVELVAGCIRNSVRPGGLVFDPFLGSGSTLIACEHAGRTCYGVELDPRYCDVIVRRWEAFTGKTAERSKHEVAS